MAFKTHSLTLDRLQALLAYDAETGIFRWASKPARRILVGSIAGCRDTDGYILIRIDGILHKAHKLAVFLSTGVYPDKVDHRNGITSENWLKNLRVATATQNSQNGKRRKNETGVRGVVKVGGSYIARIRIPGKRLHLGTFKTADDAGAAYERAAAEHHGSFYRP